MRMRNSVKAIIIENGRLLAVRKADEGGEFLVLPGGGQKPGETLTRALEREILEEVGAPVDVGKLLHVRDYIGRNHGFADLQADDHMVAFYFRCRLTTPVGDAPPPKPDVGQVGVEWVNLADLEDAPLWPKVLVPILSGDRPDAPLYLGDVN